MSKQLQIRNSTAEFLIFQAEDKAQGVQVFYHDENIWATQKAMAELYGIDKSGISRHLANIYESGELNFVPLRSKTIAQPNLKHNKPMAETTIY